MTVDAGKQSLGDVCPDGEKHGHENYETAVGAGPGGKRSALPMRIELQIAIESPNGYADAQKRWLSGECRQRCSTTRWQRLEIGWSMRLRGG